MKYKCDDSICGAALTREEVKMKPAAPNVHFMGVSLIGANKDGKPIRVAGSFQEGDQTLHCPKCGKLHLFGFDAVKEEPVTQPA